jgi:N-acetylglucosamine-6-phosphate deacetylase
MKTLIHNGTLITPTERIEDGWLLAEGGKIAAAGRGAPPGADRRIDAAGRFIAPGFIDLHAQGFRGHDLWDESDANFLAATGEMARTGVTAAQASVDAMPDVCQIMRPRIGRAGGGTRIVGLYLETPFIAPGKRGAIPLERLRPPSPDAAREVIEWSRGILSMITIAPELPGALDLVRLFRRTAGPMGPVVAAIGHTAATFDQAAAGIEAGMTHCTHLYNAMPPLLHREPGAVGALLAHPGISVEIICDGVHLHPAAVRIAIACKGVSRTCLITDCVSGLRGKVVDGAPRLADGTLAGSILSMDRAVANVQRFAGVTLEQAVEMATLTPARAAGCDRSKGSLAPGKDADVVLFDEGIAVSLTMIGGEVVWHKG